MNSKITIIISNIILNAELYNTVTGNKILDVLPLDGKINIWGNEIYFKVPINVQLEKNASEVLEIGDIGYWPEGQMFCIFFGPTPISHNEEPRAFTPVNVCGKILDDTILLKKVKPSTMIKIKKID